MANNIFGNRPNVVVAKQSVSFAACGINSVNTAIIYRVDDSLSSYVPGRAINSITGFVKDNGYWIAALQDMDLSMFVIPSIVPATQGYPLFILSGESNSGGYALNTELTSGELAVRPAVKILNNTTMLFESLQIGANNLIGHTGLLENQTHGFENGIAARVEAGTLAGSPAYLVKTGQGGSKIAEWDDGAVTGGVNYWQLFKDRVSEAVSIVEIQTGVAAFPYLLYSQGINDAVAGTSVATWKSKTIAHFQKIRAEFGQVPIAMTKFMSAYAAYNTAIDEICQSISFCYAVNTSDAELRDANHWNAAGIKTVSGRLINVLMENWAV